MRIAYIRRIFDLWQSEKISFWWSDHRISSVTGEGDTDCEWSRAEWRIFIVIAKWYIRCNQTIEWIIGICFIQGEIDQAREVQSHIKIEIRKKSPFRKCIEIRNTQLRSEQFQITWQISEWYLRWICEWNSMFTQEECERLIEIPDLFVLRIMYWKYLARVVERKSKKNYQFQR